ncbi:hypothetical protein BGE01nite_47970 [Brevifollis gellanilyticus]|uniref:Uncharacterized protein n=1 Tax=Brevifollis gellanilyticus TaxID=748831 RepID=A0A512MFM8_9BACT|nr:hypothetical protein BGE01nite_47970 [Brevifollis gellanilyticus]
MGNQGLVGLLHVPGAAPRSTQAMDDVTEAGQAVGVIETHALPLARKTAPGMEKVCASVRSAYPLIVSFLDLPA